MGEFFENTKSRKKSMAVHSFSPSQTKVGKESREALLGQKARLIWFTGLSGAGKSTLSMQLEAKLHQLGYKTYLLDGDNIRSGLNKDLSFTDEGRVENIRRIGEVSKLFLDAGIIVLSAFISPFHADRQKVREIVGSENFFEVFVRCPIEVCEERDVKGLYQRARAGQIKNFTGIDSPYEEPHSPDLILDTEKNTIAESLKKLYDSLHSKYSL